MLVAGGNEFHISKNTERGDSWMNANTMIAGALALGMLVVEVPASAQATRDDVDGLVKAVMNETYGQTYDAQSNCWAFAWKNDQGESTDYCMRAGTPQIVDGPRGKTLYLNAFSVIVMQGDSPYRYAHVQPGLMGAFKIHVGGAQGWTYEAYDSGTDYGSMGDCGCSQARLIKLSNAGDYGWIFVSGGTWQDMTVGFYSIVTAIKGRMTDVSKIPQVTEDAQGVRYDVSVKEDPAAKGFFPLHVVKTTKGAKVEAFDVPFNTTRSSYALPAGR